MQPMTPDINVLLAAARNDHPHHQPALTWLNGALQDAQQGHRLELLPMVVAGFVRLSTHPKIFIHPTPVADALAFVDALLTAPGVDMAELGREWPLFAELCRAKNLTANAIPDAWIAAAVTLLGSHLVTFDRDFLKLLPKRAVILLKA
jgi:uncharacterized protein